jgi:hypothetical protein
MRIARLAPPAFTGGVTFRADDISRAGWVAVASLLCACALPGTAVASAKAGRWTGRVTGKPGKLTFKVARGGARLNGFTFHGKYGSLHCGGTATSGSTIGSATISIPHAKVHGGRITGSRVHVAVGIRERDVLSGRIAGGSAHGTVKQSFTGGENCGTGTLTWRARAGSKPPPAAGSGGGSGGSTHVPPAYAGASFAGSTPQGHGLTLGVDAAGDAVASLQLAQLDMSCVDGSSTTVSGIAVQLIPIASDGSFSFSRTFDNGVTFNVTGKLTRNSASGVLGGDYSKDGRSCESGNVSFDPPGG